MLDLPWPLESFDESLTRSSAKDAGHSPPSAGTIRPSRRQTASQDLLCWPA